jgi:putative oxidoreductase
MPKSNRNRADWGFLMLRVPIAGLLAWYHGWGKFSGALEYLFGGNEWGFAGFVSSIGFPFPTFFALCAALAEFVGCLLLAVGWFTRYAAALVVITMSVAIFHHLRTDMRFELAAVYFLTSLFFVFAGAGKLSVDEWLRNRTKSVPVVEPVNSIA